MAALLWSLAPILSLLLFLILSNFCQRDSILKGLVGEIEDGLRGDVDIGLELVLEVGLVMGDRVLMLSRHWSSVL